MASSSATLPAWAAGASGKVLVLLGVFNALAGIVEAVLRPGIGQLVDDVRDGTLDLILVRPVEAQFYISLRHLDIWRFADVVFGFALAGFAIVHLGHSPSPLQFGAFLLAFISAAAIMYAIWVVLMSLAFWFVYVENLSALFDALYEGARYPVSAYPGAVRLLFVYLIPLAWTTTIPAATLTGRLAPALALGRTGGGGHRTGPLTAFLAHCTPALHECGWLIQERHGVSY